MSRAAFLVSMWVCLLLIASSCHALSLVQLKIKAQEPACFAYEATRSSRDSAVRVDVNYRISRVQASGNPYVTASVKGPAMIKSLTDQSLRTDGTEDRFTFSAVASGLHRVCFLLHSGADVYLQVQIEGQNDQLDMLATREGVEIAEPLGAAATYGDFLESIQLRTEVTVSELETILERNAEFEHTVQSTYIRVITFTIINAVLVISTALWQHFTLRQVFREKKVV